VILRNADFFRIGVVVVIPVCAVVRCTVLRTLFSEWFLALPTLLGLLFETVETIDWRFELSFDCFALDY